MTNFEFYKEQIQSCINDGRDFRISLTGKFFDCCNCYDCIFSREHFKDTCCSVNKMKWLCAEHVEKPTITPHEKKFLEACRDGLYITRDNDGSLYLSTNKPRKGTYGWNDGDKYIRIYEVMPEFLCISKDSFSFVKWEDEEPWSVEDLLKLEVKE